MAEDAVRDHLVCVALGGPVEISLLSQRRQVPPATRTVDQTQRC
jgi:hypothetical protein